MRILVFSEEYIKMTKGMFVVWSNYVFEAAKKHHVNVLLNNEHWAFEESSEEFKNNNHIKVDRLPFAMPSTIIKQAFSIADGLWVLRAIRYTVGQILNIISCPFIIFYFYFYLRHIQPEVVFSHNGGWPAGQLSRWIIISAYFAGIPRRILIIHNYPANTTWSLLPIRSIQAWMIEKFATSIVTVSDSVKKVLESKVFKRSVYRIYNGIQLNKHLQHTPKESSELVWNPSGMVVGFVGALYPLKGPHILLDAFKLVDVPSELVLMGPIDQDYLVLLKKRAALCSNKVSFMGFHEDVDSFMKKINFLVVPSIAYESFGMVILEAMKHSKAVICSDFGGMKEVVEDGVTGLVVPAGDEIALAKTIKVLLLDPELQHRMGQAGFQRLSEYFSSEIMEKEYDKLIKIKRIIENET